MLFRSGPRRHRSTAAARKPRRLIPCVASLPTPSSTPRRTPSTPSSPSSPRPRLPPQRLQRASPPQIPCNGGEQRTPLSFSPLLLAAPGRAKVRVRPSPSPLTELALRRSPHFVRALRRGASSSSCGCVVRERAIEPPRCSPCPTTAPRAHLRNRLLPRAPAQPRRGLATTAFGGWIRCTCGRRPPCRSGRMPSRAGHQRP